MQAGNVSVRRASARDAAACVAIYRPYVEDTAISWEIDVPAVTEMAARINGLRDTHEWLVLQRDDRVIGFAYAQALKRLPALQWAAETGIYLDADHHRTGGGATLYAELLLRLVDRGYRQAIAGITQPNEASNSLHRSLGFEDAGLYRRVVWKLGRWHDVAWMQRDLGDGSDRDAAPGPIV
ncbi:MAG: N-acetyltransferase family protein [Mycobacterium sp.]